MGSCCAGLEEKLVGFGLPDSRALLGSGIQPGGGALVLVDVPILAEQGCSRVASCWKRAWVGRTVEKERAQATLGGECLQEKREKSIQDTGL